MDTVSITRSAVLAASLWAGTATAAPFSQVYYVGVDYTQPDHHHQTAHIYDARLQPLPPAGDPRTSRIELASGRPVWLLGVKVDMVARKPGTGTFRVVSQEPAYHEMNHHFTLRHAGSSRTAYDRCGIRPFAAGSELTDLILPDGYGYHIRDGHLEGGAWHWANPFKVATGEEVYLRLTVLLDDAPTGYRDTNVTWVTANPCGDKLTIPGAPVEGEPLPYRVDGPRYPAPVPGRVVFVAPHLHDHARGTELFIGGRMVHRFVPDNADIPVAHDDAGEGSRGVHRHPGHLPNGGLPTWGPGAHGPRFAAGDALRAGATFANPHVEAIDNMDILMVFWEATPALVTQPR